MKTTEELNALKNEVETLDKKLTALSDEELEQVNGGFENLIKTIVGLVAQPIGVTITLHKDTKSE